jgi:hypothetical protein
MATIEMRPDTDRTGLWWLYWTERDELVARIDQSPAGACKITPHGPHWSPMKSFGQTFDSASSAYHEVQLYFERR